MVDAATAVLKPKTSLSAPPAPSPAVLATDGEASRLVIVADLTWSSAIAEFSLRRHVGRGRCVGAEHLQQSAGLEPRRARRHAGIEIVGLSRQVVALRDAVVHVLPDAEIGT